MTLHKFILKLFTQPSLMELGHLLTSHAILISSFFAAIALTENKKYASSLRALSNFSLIKVSGEKGAILLLFALSCIFMTIIEFISSQAKVSGCKSIYKRSRAAKHLHMQALLSSFIIFICAYIFQSLSFRVYNLLGIALLSVNLRTIFMLLGAKLLCTWLYMIFLFSLLLVFGFTFIMNFDTSYIFVASFIKLRY